MIKNLAGIVIGYKEFYFCFKQTTTLQCEIVASSYKQAMKILLTCVLFLCFDKYS